jgi:integrase
MRRNTLHVERKLVDGRIIETTKTGKSRTVEMMEQLRADLLAWRKALFVPEDSNTLIFPKAGTSNDPWKRADYENWRARKFRPAMKRIELQGRIYDLRHSYASLLIAGGYRPPYVAEQLGHTVTTSMDTYQHVFQEASDPHAWLDPDARITEARKKFGDA